MIYSLVAIGVIVLSLFLPYETHDTYTGGFYQNGTFRSVSEKTLGINHIGAYIPIALIAICLSIIKIKENLATAIISLILSVINGLYMLFLGFILVFNLNFFGGGPSNFELGFGYFLAALVGFLYVPLMIIHLIIVVRKRRNPEKYRVKMVDNELLDSMM